MRSVSLSDLKGWLAENSDFVVFRHPNTDVIWTLKAESTLTINSFSELTEIPSGFIFAPFDLSNSPVLILQGEKTTLSASEQGCLFPNSSKASGKTNPGNTICPNYEKDFAIFKQALQKGDFQKLVLARGEEFTTQADPIQLFQEACDAYPNSMVYLMNSQQCGRWLGATPELLLESDGSQLHTVALAGTMSAPPLQQPCLWNEKNKREQSIVTDYLRKNIGSIGKITKEQGPYTYPSAHLVHLKTDLYLQVEKKHITRLICSLHPTPAVCGLPKREALEFICSHETLQREYYAGFLGHKDSDESFKLFVNLRCMKWTTSSNVRLIAGGGLLSDSILEQEWDETKIKMQTLLRLPSF